MQSQITAVSQHTIHK